MTATPAGHEPHRPTTGGPLAPPAPGTAPIRLNRVQKTVAATVGTGTAFIAALGFAGSYSAVAAKARTLGFGWFANWIPIGVDSGIGIFLALDLLLTWLRIPFPLLRHIAWLLTASTIVFNASTSWPNPLGVSMHAVIPVLFIAATEAARHAVGRIADITADKHLEGPSVSRWFLNPVSTFILWRRQRLWAIRLWDTVLELERERRVYKGKLRKEYGRAWRRKASADKLLVLRLATKDGLSITEAIELPAKEEEKRRQEADRIKREAEQAADERQRQADDYKREQQRLEDERLQKAEDDRIERERKALALEQDRQEAARNQQLADAQHQARLDEIARQQREAAEEAEQRRQREALEYAKAVAAEQERAAAAARQRRQNEEAAARAAAEKEAANRRAAEIVQRAASASASSAPASRAANPASASRTATSQPANAATNRAANDSAESASATSANGASPAATSPTPANASASDSAATSASDDAITEVVDVYTLLKEQNGKAPSDRELGDALGVSRSRAQQLRTAAIDAGHTELAKPMRLAS